MTDPISSPAITTRIVPKVSFFGKCFSKFHGVNNPLQISILFLAIGSETVEINFFLTKFVSATENLH